ncbi:Zinc-binding oxidoreductase [Phaffia rhodozyma]|uniref:Zinc-binding oxidoreductase n=1 Tax=Phaffia rhodozyma TaxID=264483 RepID=A0A0F7SWC1_PHARH|nr:Zinc-binding oxidoreductase [Phaffia rhodozyma]
MFPSGSSLAFPASLSSILGHAHRDHSEKEVTPVRRKLECCAKFGHSTPMDVTLVTLDRPAGQTSPKKPTRLQQLLRINRVSPVLSDLFMASLPPVQQVWLQKRRGDHTKSIELNTQAPIPALEPGHVLVRVRAVALNPLGVKTMSTIPSFARKFPTMLENDLCGEILNPNDSEFQIGDEVFGMSTFEDCLKKGRGALGQYILVKTENLAHKPKNITADEAAGITLAGLTAYQGLVDQCKITAGQRLFINGGNSTVGRFAIQIAKNLGAYVVTSCSGENALKVKSFGADEIIDYKRVDLPSYLVKNYTSNPFDAIYDVVGNILNFFPRSAPVLNPKGLFLTISIDLPKGLGSKMRFLFLLFNVAVRPTWLGGVNRKWKFVTTKSNKTQLNTLAKLASEEKLRVDVDSTYGFDQAGLFAAFDRMKTNKACGKIVVHVP